MLSLCVCVCLRLSFSLSVYMKIRIWNTEPMLNEKAEQDPQCHKLLSTLTLHSGAVLCVRWSNSGKYLASGSDTDNTIIIWELDEQPTTLTPFGTQDINRETWRAAHYLRNHKSDVQDLAWSKDDKYLASCGVDGLVIVWDGKTLDQVHVIDQHNGIVKGVAWDPAGQYLASQADDKKTKIWRTRDWGLEKDITNPFINAPEITLFRRISWSPVGSHLVTANAVNGPECVASIVDRSDWEPKMSLFGHQTPVVISKFNPNMFYSSHTTTSHHSLVAMCATGSHDGSVAIWSTENSVPICAADGFFRMSVYDLTWSPDGQTLYACSEDGTVGYINLAGYMPPTAPESEIKNALAKLGYGQPSMILAETPMQLDMEESNAIATKIASSKRIAGIMGTSSPTKSFEEPIQLLTTSSRPTLPSVTIQSSSSSAPTSFHQTEVVKDGKRRIQPFQVSTHASHNIEPNVFVEKPNSQTKRPRLENHSPISPPPTIQENNVNYTNPSVYLPSHGLGTQISGNRRPPTTESFVDTTPVVRERPAWVDGASIPHAVLESKVKLAIPTVRSRFLQKWGSKGQMTVMETQNNTHQGKHKELSKVTVSSEGVAIWEDYLPSPVLLMTGNHIYSAVGCENATLHIYSPSGKRLFPPMVLESTPVILHCYEQWLLCLTATGLLFTWDIPNRKSHIKSVSIAPILGVSQLPADKTSSPSIQNVQIRKNGVALLITNQHKAFTYDIMMDAWMCISDAWYTVSDFWHPSSRSTTPDKHPLGWLTASIASKQPSDSALDIDGAVTGDFRDIMTLSHIEIQLAVAVLLDSPEEYRQWLVYYAKRLTKTNAKNKIEDLLGWLAGPPFIPANETWEPDVLKLSKKELLKQILPILASNRQLQRTIQEYSGCT
ncbi:WD40-repeat-containing domain protein [Phycomyces nitens]|nr:WD40-repeat-containing domain protein [Phycomyces nitens]